jgi:hypothetical protein
MKRVISLAAGAVVFGLALPAVAQVTHLCSGTSEEQRAQAEATPHTLRLVYADPGGSFLGEVTTRITDTAGQVLVEVTCPGPWLLADLPGGQYEVTATFRGESKTQTVSVDGQSQQEQVITF